MRIRFRVTNKSTKKNSRMSRVAVHRTLPPLKKVFKNFSKFPEGRSQQQVMVELLRDAAMKLRSENPQPFYSMREVSRFFEAPLAAIYIVYKVLEREGILNRIRSSRTVLAGRAALSRETVRGVVGLPIWMHSIVLLVYTRVLTMEIEEHLRRAGYVADIIFHSEKEDESQPEFATRLLLHNLDAVILHTPLASCRQNILSLRERGVRVLILQRLEAPRDLPAVIYLLDYDPAYEKMAARWKESGISEAWIWGPLDQLHYQEEEDSFRKILKNHGIEWKLMEEEPAQMEEKLRHYAGKSSVAVAFIGEANPERICNCDPYSIEQISRMARLAFCGGTLRIPFLQMRKVRADIVDFSPTETAMRLAQDIGRLSILPDGVLHTFEANYAELALL
jgi:hypothetical protein